MLKSIRCLFILGLAIVAVSFSAQAKKNVIFILSDDHRYDFMSFMPQAPKFLETPSLDQLANEGMHIKNAFVTTSLCSPSRASILTGRYAHHHGVVDNSSPIPEGTRFLPEALQDAGYQTAFIGKWHMGDEDDNPQAGVNRWVSFKGQGKYQNPLLNIDGKQSQHQGYTSDILTDYAIDFLSERDTSQPFFLYLSHKAVHADFIPSKRHKGKYSDATPEYPGSMDKTQSNVKGKPEWVKRQRNSWHGVDYAYHGNLVFADFYKSYAETLLGVDDSVGRVLQYVKDNELSEDTIIIYMGDNGFLLGEHGLIDKRNAYEASIRVPMIAWGPSIIESGTTANNLVRNIDITPTVLDLAETKTDLPIDGRTIVPMLKGDAANTSDESFLYEYYWEYAFPHTPTTFAIRENKYKYIYYHGIWDTNELYDIENDPNEMHNLINLPQYASTKERLRKALFDRLDEDNAMSVPMRRVSWQRAEELIK